MIPPADWLTRLGSGEPIARLCAGAGVGRAEFDAWWRAECRRRVPSMTGTRNLPGLRGPVRIARDPRGVPHVSAGTDRDLFFGFGFAVAQDRLFQLDHIRRKAAGRLAEVIGPEVVESDRLFRTLDLAGLAEREWAGLPTEARDLVAAYAAGVDAVIAESRDNLPIEFDLLGYRPEPWRPVDCLLVLNEFRWYLTVRFPVIAVPELVKRSVGDGPLFREFTTGEADDESILHPGEYPAGRRRDADAGGGEESPGSNNWVLAGHRTTTGKPVVASDPHVPFAAVSIWYQVVLCGGSFRVAGASLAGVPAVMLGRTPRVAWGITNNICSLRDLYQEKTAPAHPGCFLFDGNWEPARQRQETIRVRGAEDVTFTVRSSRNGPVVDDVLPPAARHTGPVSLRWQGFEPCGWLTALLALNRATTATEFRAAGEPWGVPTFNLVFADVDGHTGFQTVGKIPVRDIPQRGYRPGWDPAHQWRGTIPYSELPALTDPPRGYVVTANNRLAPDDFPWPLSGAWSSGHRARRARGLIEGTSTHTPADNRAYQLDVYSGQAAAVVPVLLDAVGGDPEFAAVVELLRGWDFRTTAESAAPAVCYLFTYHWIRTVLRERMPAEQIELAVPFAGGLAVRLLRGDPHGWFRDVNSEEVIRASLRAAVTDLTVRCGPDPAGWTWGKLHTLTQKHVLSGRGDLGSLLDRSGFPMAGDGSTLFNATSDPTTHAAISGAGFRMIADLADPSGGLWAIEVAGASGHPGSPHYDDQIRPWLAGAYYSLTLTEVPPDAAAVQTLQPLGDS
jgi:penicillin amidase